MEPTHNVYGRNDLVIDKKKEMLHLMSQMRKFKEEVGDFLEEMEMLNNKETVKGIEEGLKDARESSVHRYKDIGKFKAKFKIQ